MKLSLHLALARIKKKRARNRRRDFDFGEVAPHVDSDSEPELELELSDEEDQNGPAAEQQLNSDAGTGAINPAFLDASPEDLRAEALSAQWGQVAPQSNAEPSNAVNQFIMDRSISFSRAVTKPLFDAEKRKKQKKKVKIEAGESNTNNVSLCRRKELDPSPRTQLENWYYRKSTEEERKFESEMNKLNRDMVSVFDHYGVNEDMQPISIEDLEQKLVDKREDIKKTLLDKLGDLDHGKVRIDGTEKEKLEGFVNELSSLTKVYMLELEKCYGQLVSLNSKISMFQYI